ncbi:hypothetical protein Lal_00047493 [Lupinus albus]|nr:hypothetical protein Lal_00047493 [Lupinus albus]
MRKALEKNGVLVHFIRVTKLSRISDVVMTNILIEHIQDLVPQCLLCINDTVLMGESREGINCKLDLCKNH